MIAEVILNSNAKQLNRATFPGTLGSIQRKV